MQPTRRPGAHPAASRSRSPSSSWAPLEWAWLGCRAFARRPCLSGYVATTLPHFVAFVDQPANRGRRRPEKFGWGQDTQRRPPALLIAWDEHVYFTAYL